MFWVFLFSIFVLTAATPKISRHNKALKTTAAKLIPFKRHWVTFLFWFQPLPDPDATPKTEKWIFFLFLYVCIVNTRDNLSAALQQEIMWDNICIFRATVRSHLINNCHCYLQAGILQNNTDKTDKWRGKSERRRRRRRRRRRSKRRRKKKSHYLLKRERRGSDHGSSKLGKRKKKEKKHRLAFLFTLKNPSATWKLQFSISAELHYWASEWLKRHNIMGQIHTTDLLLQMISTSLIISPEMFSFDTGCNESYDVVKSRQRGFRRVLSFLRQTYKNNISPPLQFREFLYLMSFIILEIK